MQPPTIEAGWRFLQIGEAFKLGDEFWCIGDGPWIPWAPSYSDVEIITSAHFAARRKVEIIL